MKKLLKPFFLPPLCIILLILYGLIASSKGKARGKFCIVFGVFLLYALCISPVTNILVNPLESRYTPVRSLSSNTEPLIVVLLGGTRINDRFPVANSFNYASLSRALEAYRLYKMGKNPKICVVGGNGDPFGSLRESKRMRDFIVTLGVPRKKVIVEDESRDTYENLKAIKRLVQDKHFWLVTSAVHMPRTMFLARKLGLKAIPAPCGSYYSKSSGIMSYFPDPFNFTASVSAINEYLGLLWYKIAFLVGLL